MPTWPVASGSLVLGFAVASATGVRPLGGLVLVAAAAWCARRWWSAAGLPTALALLMVYAAAFALSHVIADATGTWPAVVIVATVAGVAAWGLADRRRAAPAT